MKNQERYTMPIKSRRKARTNFGIVQRKTKFVKLIYQTGCFEYIFCGVKFGFETRSFLVSRYC